MVVNTEERGFYKSMTFLTPDGVMSFGNCVDGQPVEILDCHGIKRSATVRKSYIKKSLYRAVFVNASGLKKYVYGSNNLGYFLNDGTWTSSIKAGDVLFKSSEYADVWTCTGISEYYDSKITLYSIIEPITHTIVLSGGVVMSDNPHSVVSDDYAYEIDNTSCTNYQTNSEEPVDVEDDDSTVDTASDDVSTSSSTDTDSSSGSDSSGTSDGSTDSTVV